MNNEETEPELEPPQLLTGYIYALLYVNFIYIGSTTNLKNRYSKHKSDSKKSNKNLYQKIRNIGDFDIFKLIIIEKIEFNNISELRKLEQYYYNIYKNNDYFTILNKFRCYLTSEDRKDYKQSYYKSDKFKEYKKNYYIRNKDYILERIKQQRNYKKLS